MPRRNRRSRYSHKTPVRRRTLHQVVLRCTNGKVAYETAGAAEAAIERHRTSIRAQVPVRSYLCPLGPHWHVTSWGLGQPSPNFRRQAGTLTSSSEAAQPR